MGNRLIENSQKMATKKVTEVGMGRAETRNSHRRINGCLNWEFVTIKGLENKIIVMFK